MAALGLAPGPAVGRALSFLMGIRLEEGLIGKDEALERLRAYWAKENPDR
jgi:poly(A) polymerase